MAEKIYDIVIIGGGIAGLTAAVYARRAGKDVLVIENNSFGGQISLSPSVENFPGFSEISGGELSDRLYAKASELSTEFAFETVTEIKNEQPPKAVITDSDEHLCLSVIIASGLTHRKTGIATEEKFIGRGVSYCAVCDGNFFKGKDVAVYGGGNTAVGDALFLSDICNSVTLIHRRDSFRADKSLTDKLKTKNNIKYALNSTLTEIGGETNVTSVTVTDKLSGEETQIDVSAVFIAIGQLPQNSAFENVVELDGNGFIKADETCKTSADGIFAAGDCRTKELRQLTTAAADGSVSATNACKYVDGLKG